MDAYRRSQTQLEVAIAGNGVCGAQALQAALPPEPNASAGEATSACAVRLPDGRRVARRFLRSAPLQQLFDFVDAKVQAVALFFLGVFIIDCHEIPALTAIVQYPPLLSKSGAGFVHAKVITLRLRNTWLSERLPFPS